MHEPLPAAPVTGQRARRWRCGLVGKEGRVTELAKVGLEPIDASTIGTKDLRQSPQASAAKSGAVDAATLLALIQSLPAEERARLFAALGSHPDPGIATDATNAVEAPPGSSPRAGEPGGAAGAVSGPAVEE